MGIVQIIIDDSTSKIITGSYEFDRDGGGTLIAPAGTLFPVTPVAGEWFWRTDEKKLYRRNDTNNAWDAVEAAVAAHGNEKHSPSMLTVGGNRNDVNLDILTDGDEDADVDALHLHIRRDKSKAYLWDDFVGNALDASKWATTVSGTGSSVSFPSSPSSAIGGYARLTSGGNVNSLVVLHGGEKNNWSVGKNVSMECRFKIVHVANAWNEIKLHNNSTIYENAVYFYRNGSGNWFARTVLNDVVTETDTGVVTDVSYHAFKIECSSSQIVFKIDGVVKAAHTTNIPTTTLEPFIKQKTIAGTSTRQSYLDWIEIFGDRD